MAFRTEVGLLSMLLLASCGGDGSTVRDVGRGRADASERDGEVGGVERGGSDAGAVHADGGGDGSAEPGGEGAGGGIEHKKLADLTWAEQRALCEDFSPKAVRIEEAINHGVCTLGGIREGGPLLSCEDFVAQCFMWVVPVQEENCDASADQVLPDCPQLTVGQFRGCFEQILATLEGAYGSLTCESDAANAEDVKVPAECTVHYAACPELEAFEQLFAL